VDVPNERSSHGVPTPTGGGLVIVLVSLLAYLIISITLTKQFSKGYFFGALIIAVVSWSDDLYSLSVAWRLLAHIVAAVLVVISTGYWDLISIPGSFTIAIPRLGPLITVVWIVWMINAYNFMDGIDGIAGLQAIVTSAGWVMICLANGSADFAYPLALLGSCAGFLIHNWQPARIFMGDVGSAFLGFTFASMPLLLDHKIKAVGAIPILSALLIWPFFFDTVITLIVRVYNKEPIWRAHRSHLYQRLVIRNYSHATVSLLYGLFALASSLAGVYLLRAQGITVVALLGSVLVVSLIFAIGLLISEKPLAPQN